MDLTINERSTPKCRPNHDPPRQLNSDVID
jgi:hypothetical protein